MRAAGARGHGRTARRPRRVTFGGHGPSARALSADATMRNDRSGRRRARSSEQREVPSRIGADRDDVVVRLSARLGAEVLGVDAEGDELDPRAAVAEPGSQLLDLAPAVRDDRVEPTERVGEEPSRGAAPRSCSRRSGSRSPRTRPAAARDRAARGARAGSRRCRRSRRRRRRDSAREATRARAAKSPE